MVINRARTTIVSATALAASSLLLVAQPSPASIFPTTRSWVDIAARPSGDGYWLANSAGIVLPFGAAASHGDAAGLPLRGRIVGIASTPSGNGYWLVGKDGGVFAYGDARFHGSAAGFHLAAPISGIDRTPSGKGYWLLGEDGGVFAFGDATFLGRPTKAEPATGLASAPTGGYFVVRSGGGPQGFGSAGVSSMISSSVGNFVDVASTPTGQGAWMAGANGEMNARGDAASFGDAFGLPLQAPITAAAATATGQGYWLLGEDGGVFAYGDARYMGRAVTVQP